MNQELWWNYYYLVATNINCSGSNNILKIANLTLSLFGTNEETRAETSQKPISLLPLKHSQNTRLVNTLPSDFNDNITMDMMLHPGPHPRVGVILTHCNLWILWRRNAPLKELNNGNFWADWDLINILMGLEKEMVLGPTRPHY